MLSKLADEFEARNICVLICGNDSGEENFRFLAINCVNIFICFRSSFLPVSNYRKWIKDIEELQSVKVVLPLLSDGDCSVLRQVM